MQFTIEKKVSRTELVEIMREAGPFNKKVNEKRCVKQILMRRGYLELSDLIEKQFGST